MARLIRTAGIINLGVAREPTHDWTWTSTGRIAVQWAIMATQNVGSTSSQSQADLVAQVERVRGREREKERKRERERERVEIVSSCSRGSRFHIKVIVIGTQASKL